MNDMTLQLIKAECEKIERSSGHGQVIVTIQDGVIHLIKPTEYILVPKLDNHPKK